MLVYYLRGIDLVINETLRECWYPCKIVPKRLGDPLGNTGGDITLWSHTLWPSAKLGKKSGEKYGCWRHGGICYLCGTNTERKKKEKKTVRRAKNTSQSRGRWSSRTQADHLGAAEPSWMRAGKPLIRESLLEVHPGEGSGQGENAFTRKGLISLLSKGWGCGVSKTENLCPLHAVFPQRSGPGPLVLWQWWCWACCDTGKLFAAV